MYAVFHRAIWFTEFNYEVMPTDFLIPGTEIQKIEDAFIFAEVLALEHSERKSIKDNKYYRIGTAKIGAFKMYTHNGFIVYYMVKSLKGLPYK